MKKFLIILLSLALIVLCVGCGTYEPPIIVGGENIVDGDKDKPKPDDKDDDNNNGDVGFEDDLLVFTVTLNTRNAEGKLVRFPARESDNIQAQWTALDGGNGNHTAQVDSTGVATAKGLDGEFRVTLSNLPASYTYDPNGIYVDNDFRDVEIELLNVISTSGTGKGLYESEGCIVLNSVGTYKAVIQKKYIAGQYNVSDGSIIYFQFTPSQSGYYSLESMVDITDEKINPIMDKWSGTSAFKFNPITTDGGGSEGEFTKNFKWEISLPPAEVGNCWTFGIKADAIKGVDFPVTIYFKLTYIGENNGGEIVKAKGPFYKGDVITGDFQWSYKDNIQVDSDGNPITDKNGHTKYYTDNSIKGGTEMRFRLWWVDLNANGIFDEADEGDGFYHYYSMEKYPNGYTEGDKTYPAGYGPLLWTIIGGWDDVCHSYTGSSGNPPPPPTPTNNLIGRAFNIDGKNYNYFLLDYTVYAKPYKTYTEIGGSITTTIHPVNQELVGALQKFATAFNYFNDGEGHAEAGPIVIGEYDCGYRVDSDEDHMWLVFCGYFK